MNSPYDTTIYIIDNDNQYAKTLKNELITTGFKEVIIFSSALLALDVLLIRKKRNSLIISEIAFKAINGEDFFIKLKEKYENLKLLILSKSEKLGDRLRAFGKYGASLFLTKTTTLKSIITHVIRIINEVTDINFLITTTITEIEECLITKNQQLILK